MIANLLKYAEEPPCSASFRKAFDFLKTLSASAADGTYEIEGRKIYAMVQSAETSGTLPAKLELHRKYIDIQYVFEGTERMIYAPDDGKLDILTPYDAEKDYLFVKPPAALTSLDVIPGMFCVFTPRDAHYGKLISPSAGVCAIRKVVVKVALDMD